MDLILPLSSPSALYCFTPNDRTFFTMFVEKASYDATGVDMNMSDASPDDFEFVNGNGDLPYRPKCPPPQYPLSVDVHPLKNTDEILVSLHPPREPETKIKHVPCDIILVIDVSGSMSSAAPLPDAQGQKEKESSGLTILDLTKHAARTIMETLNEGDRLGLVTFSTDAKIVQPLVSMTAAAKKKTNAKIESLVPDSSTNLWSGIRTGLKMFEEAPFMGNVQGLFVLTDGMPNHMCPPQGYVAKLGPMLKEMAFCKPCIPTIHTFGFGYSILSNLMQSIAEVGNGNYAFIPDAGMIGTVFVHAVANLYTTYATAAVLELSTSDSSSKLLFTAGIPSEQSSPSQVCLKLGNIQYGQSRDIVVRCSQTTSKAMITAKLTYKLPNGNSYGVATTANISSKTGLPSSSTDYHVHRNRLCSFLASLFPLAGNGEHVRDSTLPADVKNGIEDLASGLKASLASPIAAVDKTNMETLLSDLQGVDPAGQISQALTPQYYQRWGCHYLPSLLHAHMRQTCNSFKDPGPLRYGIGSPLFTRCRDELDAAFDRLPAPKPSQHRQRGGRFGSMMPGAGNGQKFVHLSSLSRYNSSSNPCFLGSCLVTIAEDRSKTVPIASLKPGTSILNPITQSVRKVVAVVKTENRHCTNFIYRIGDGLWITAYHPVLVGSRWVFPIEVAEEIRALEVDEAVYSVLLERSDDVDAHCLEAGNMTCVTLGHGVTTDSAVRDDAQQDVRTHSFFGNYEAVLRSLTVMGKNEVGQLMCAGTFKDSKTDLVCGFTPAVNEKHEMEVTSGFVVSQEQISVAT